MELLLVLIILAIFFSISALVIVLVGGAATRNRLDREAEELREERWKRDWYRW